VFRAVSDEFIFNRRNESELICSYAASRKNVVVLQQQPVRWLYGSKLCWRSEQ